LSHDKLRDYRINKHDTYAHSRRVVSSATVNEKCCGMQWLVLWSDLLHISNCDPCHKGFTAALLRCVGLRSTGAAYHPDKWGAATASTETLLMKVRWTQAQVHLAKQVQHITRPVGTECFESWIFCKLPPATFLNQCFLVFAEQLRHTNISRAQVSISRRRSCSNCKSHAPRVRRTTTHR
jgi:hypothetical protein